jgi:hypothetical protein
VACNQISGAVPHSRECVRTDGVYVRGGPNTYGHHSFSQIYLLGLVDCPFGVTLMDYLNCRRINPFCFEPSS